MFARGSLRKGLVLGIGPIDLTRRSPIDAVLRR